MVNNENCAVLPSFRVCHDGYGIKIGGSDNISEYFKRTQLHHLYVKTPNCSPELIVFRVS
jgi:hypothetical protein